MLRITPKDFHQQRKQHLGTFNPVGWAKRHVPHLFCAIEDEAFKGPCCKISAGVQVDAFRQKVAKHGLLVTLTIPEERVIEPNDTSPMRLHLNYTSLAAGQSQPGVRSPFSTMG